RMIAESIRGHDRINRASPAMKNAPAVAQGKPRILSTAAKMTMSIAKQKLKRLPERHRATLSAVSRTQPKTLASSESHLGILRGDGSNTGLLEVRASRSEWNRSE